MLNSIADFASAAFNQVDWPFLGLGAAMFGVFGLLWARDQAATERDLLRKGFHEFGRHKRGCLATKTGEIDDCECGYADFLADLRGE